MGKPSRWQGRGVIVQRPSVGPTLTKIQPQAQIMEANIEGIRTTEGLGELVHGSDAGRELLLQHFSRALERTIQVVQAKLEEADLEVPAALWDSVRDDVSPPDPSEH
ncbi:hypothetical protein LIER_29988 [Lithospermum erythrorhizon]|uniref:Uncharacterized protein n=1 Tax=Lithospermum erythrorhizon TaxID=34254 RepID=A0AAV3RP11_LITER